MVVQWAGSAVQSNMQISWLNEAMHTDHITDNHALTWNVYPYSTTVKTDNNSKLSKSIIQKGHKDVKMRKHNWVWYCKKTNINPKGIFQHIFLSLQFLLFSELMLKRHFHWHLWLEYGHQLSFNYQCLRAEYEITKVFVQQHFAETSHTLFKGYIDIKKEAASSGNIGAKEVAKLMIYSYWKVGFITALWMLLTTMWCGFNPWQWRVHTTSCESCLYCGIHHVLNLERNSVIDINVQNGDIDL